MALKMSKRLINVLGKCGTSLFVMTLVVLLMASEALYAGKPKYQVMEGTEYIIADSSKAKQTIGDVTIEVTSLCQDQYTFPEIYSFGDADQNALVAKGFNFKNVSLWYPKDNEGKRWINVFGSPAGEPFLLAYKVKITNNTQHIISFKDIQVFVSAAGLEEPTPPTDDYEVYAKWIFNQEQTFDKNRKKSILDFPYPVGIATAIFLLRFPDWKKANIVYKQALPRFSASGLLLFPVSSGFDDVRLMFLEVPTKTDAAGNITEKSGFEFPFKMIKRKAWYDKKQTKRWIYGDPPEK
jgi:hypothetical protein